MNLFNRAVLVLLCLLVATLAIAVIVLAWTASTESIEWLRDAADWLDENNQDLEKSLLTAGAAVVALVALIVVAIEVLPRPTKHVQVTDLQAGNAVLSTAAIGQRVEEAVNRVPHVSDVRASVKAKRKGVLVDLDLHVDPEANLATVTDDACNAAREVLTERVHVALLRPPRARLHYRELRLRGRALQPARVASVAPAAPPPLAEERPAPPRYVPMPEPGEVKDEPPAAVAAPPSETNSTFETTPAAAAEAPDTSSEPGREHTSSGI